ncbi:MAG: hypothetical protein INH34_19570, partial [Phycisphaerales bacterium]|nr:hypothetical protein [Phycisphaerales bacterium]MCA3010581.1 hypothetical protein [Phycisphaerales bacterium]
MHRLLTRAALVAAITAAPLFAQDLQEQLKTLRRDVGRLADELTDERVKLLADLKVNGK